MHQLVTLAEDAKAKMQKHAGTAASAESSDVPAFT